jgi:phage baseplate assembly protein W
MERDMSVQVPHFAFPFAVDGSSFALREQNSIEEIQDCVEVLILTPVGSRMVFPSYGAPEVLYTQAPANIPAIVAACNMWEKRATVVINDIIDALDEKITHIRIQITGGS